MKKKISLLLSCVIALLLCACGGTDSPESAGTQTEQEYWTLVYATDEFGDVDESAPAGLRAPIDGKFSNTATTDEYLTGYAFIQPANIGHYLSIRLFEYGDNHVIYSSADAKSLMLKIKVGDTIKQYSMVGVPPNGDFILHGDNSQAIVDLLYAGEDVRCIIEIGTSKYSFTIKSENIISALDELYATN